MFKLIRNAVRIVVGSLCTVVGVIGVILPLIPGIPFLLAAAACFMAIEA